MTKSILVSLAILTLSTSAALAAHRTHHRNAMNAFAGVAASPVVWTGGVSSSDRALYIRNLHDSGYNLKNNFNASGNVASQ
jgi:3,4-dihydroxy-2-butanone 4-phosphate synthase